MSSSDSGSWNHDGARSSRSWASSACMAWSACQSASDEKAAYWRRVSSASLPSSK
ncbi:hypothetical protein OV079_21795 [Nannocystis pusilla]|uniref:Uncharacterized protein n=1 Tax=Nannocystis pusilla TaxID=889268 RepID=A0A9X3IY52_9BACT|nr:hypothetical protein [Nannocystis pusilla]MCY1008141.1 hypothetical protein [Nannocystis pusilla]